MCEEHCVCFESMTVTTSLCGEQKEPIARSVCVDYVTLGNNTFLAMFAHFVPVGILSIAAAFVSFRVAEHGGM